MKYYFLTSALILVAAMPAAAQNGSFARRQFTFLDNDVTIEVQADMPGTLQVVRGEAGVIDVSGRVPGGMPAFALGGHGEKLRLVAVGGDYADFIAIVPENVYLRIHVPGKNGDVGSTRPGGTFRWPGRDGSPAPSAAQSLPPAPMGPVVAHSAENAPRVLTIPRLANVRTVTVRLQASSFQVGGNYYMSVVNGGSDNVEIRTSSNVDDLFVNVPAMTRDFTLRLGGHAALNVHGSEVSTSCEPVAEQSLPDGEHWFTFTPEAGVLRCR